MKKLVIFLIAIFAFVAFANAQRTYTASLDTITDAGTVNTAAINSSTSKGVITIQAEFTELTGTAAGTALIQGSVDGVGYQTIIETTGLFHFYPNDTLTIVDGAVMQIVVTNSPYKFYRVSAVGSGTQTTELLVTYLPKLK